LLNLCALLLLLLLLLQVAVKVLDGHAVLRRDETTGFCLEALLSEQLKVSATGCNIASYNEFARCAVRLVAGVLRRDETTVSAWRRCSVSNSRLVSIFLHRMIAKQMTH
jgi:hypothetical protein